MSSFMFAAENVARQRQNFRRDLKQDASLKKKIVEGYRAVGSLNDSFQSSTFLLLLLLFFIEFGQW